MRDVEVDAVWLACLASPPGIGALMGLNPIKTGAGHCRNRMSMGGAMA